MSSVFKHRKLNKMVVEAAPHPRGGPIEDGEYYMVDPPRNGVSLLAWPGETHRVVYWLDGSGADARILYQACERIVQAERLLSKPFAGFTPEDVLRQLEETIVTVRKKTLPRPQAFQGMPYVGMEVWVVSPNRTVVPVKVTEIAEMDGVMSVIFGLHYKPNGQWFWTKEAAEAFLTEHPAETVAKNVFLG